MNTTTLERLYRQHHDHTVRTVGRSRELRQVADDAAQAAWLILARKPDGYLDERTAAAWLATVAYHEALKLIHANTATASGNVDLPSALVDDLDTHHEALELLRATARLRPNRRHAIEARLAGLSYREAAAKHGSTYTAVNRGVTEGRDELRELLA